MRPESAELRSDRVVSHTAFTLRLGFFIVSSAFISGWLFMGSLVMIPGSANARAGGGGFYKNSDCAGHFVVGGGTFVPPEKCRVPIGKSSSSPAKPADGTPGRLLASPAAGSGR